MKQRINDWMNLTSVLFQLGVPALFSLDRLTLQHVQRDNDFFIASFHLSFHLLVFICFKS